MPISIYSDVNILNKIKDSHVKCEESKGNVEQL